MITIKRLKKLIKDLPNDAKCYAYEGERRGIAICQKLFSELSNDEIFGIKKTTDWWIDASECNEEETYTEGFKKETK